MDWNSQWQGFALLAQQQPLLLPIVISVLLALVTLVYFLSGINSRSTKVSVDEKVVSKNKKKKKLKREKDGDDSYSSNYSSLSSGIEGESHFVRRYMNSVVKETESRESIAKSSRRRKARAVATFDAPPDAPLKREDSIPAGLDAFLSVSKQIPVLDLSGVSIGNKGIEAILAAIGNRNPIHSLRLINCNISTKGARVLARLLQLSQEQGKELKSLTLSNNLVDWNGACEIAKWSQKLHTLNLSSNAMQDGDVEKSERFRENILSDSASSCLTVLDLSGNQIGRQGASIFSEFYTLRCLSYLNLSRNKLHNHSMKFVAQLLSKSKSLKTLLLGRNCISATGAEMIASSFAENTTLTSLDLTHNRIGDRGVKALVCALMANTNIPLATIKLRCVSLGGGGLAHLSGLLASNRFKSLADLNLSKNRFTYGEIVAEHKLGEFDLTTSFLSAIAGNTHLTTLSLSDNMISGCGEVVRDALSKNQALRSVSFSNCGFDGDAIRLLGQCLPSNPRITSLDLSGNMIHGVDTFRKLARSLKKRYEALAPIPPFPISINISNTMAKDTGLKQLLASGMSLAEVVRLDNTEIMGAALKELVRVAIAPDRQIGQISLLKKLHLSCNSIGREGVEHLCTLLSSPKCTVVELNLATNKITDDAFELLGNSLRINMSVTDVVVEHNKISAEGLNRYDFHQLIMDRRHPLGSSFSKYFHSFSQIFGSSRRPEYSIGEGSNQQSGGNRRPQKTLQISTSQSWKKRRLRPYLKINYLLQP